MEENPGTDVSGGENGRVPMGFGGLYASVGDHIGHFYQTGEERTYWQIHGEASFGQFTPTLTSSQLIECTALLG